MYIYVCYKFYISFPEKLKNQIHARWFFSSICGTRFWSNFLHDTSGKNPNFHSFTKNGPKLLQRNHNPVFVFLDLIYNIKGQYFYINAYKIRTFWFNFFKFDFLLFRKVYLIIMVGTILILIKNKYKVKSGGRGGRNSFKYVWFSCIGVNQIFKGALIGLPHVHR